MRPIPMQFSFDAKFRPSAEDLGSDDAGRVWSAIRKYEADRSSPGLNLEKIRVGGRTAGRLWTIRASKELRILLAIEGDVTVFCRAGHHDAIYTLANRSAFRAPRAGSPGLVDLGEDPRATEAPPRTAAAPAARRPRSGGAEPLAPARRGDRLLEHWSDRELLDARFHPDEVARLRRATADTLLDVWPDVPDSVFDRIFACDESTPEEFSRLLFQSEEQRRRAQRFRDAIVERGAVAGLSSLLSGTELQKLLAAPIEDWMIFLHPDQRSLVDRHYSGPARVRGAAGTGKTVVALHRAAALARKPEFRSRVGGGNRPPILFTTFVSNLPRVCANLHRRLPGAVDGAVDFVNVDRLAARICHEGERAPRTNHQAAESAFRKAHDAVALPGTPLANARLTPRYLQDELERVVKRLW